MDLISRKAVKEEIKNEWDGCCSEYGPKQIINDTLCAVDRIPTVPAVPLDKLCELLAEMYHCPGSGWPSSDHACHPYCPDEAFEKLCGIDCDNHTDAERWKVFLKHWMEEQDAQTDQPGK